MGNLGEVAVALLHGLDLFLEFLELEEGGGPGLRRIGSRLRRRIGRGRGRGEVGQAHLGLGMGIIGTCHMHCVGLGKARLWKRLGVGIHLVRGVRCGGQQLVVALPF